MALTIKDMKKDEKIIAVMGPTGAGKSTFITTATGKPNVGVGHTLNSFTEEVKAFRCQTASGAVVFVDTPGFDDTTRPDTEILKLIAGWLEKTYKRGIKLTGILYLHRITDNRMAGSPLRNLHLFESLCGADPLKSVVLVTTMWTTKLRADQGPNREKELTDKFWKPMLDQGSATMRFTDTYDSAWEIVNSIIQKRIAARPVLIQEELVDLNRRLRETEAGRTLYAELVRLLEEHKATVQKLRQEAEKQGPYQSAPLRRELEKQLNDVNKLLTSTMNQVDEMKIPLLARFKLFFRKKPNTASLSEIES